MQNQAADRWAAAQATATQIAERIIRDGKIDRDEWFGVGDLFVARWEVRDVDADPDDMPVVEIDRDIAFAKACVANDAGEPADVWEVRPDGSERRIRA